MSARGSAKTDRNCLRRNLQPHVYAVGAIYSRHLDHCIAGTQTGGGIWGICPPENFKMLHSNFDICRNFQRIKMKFYILFPKIFRNAVCVYALILFLTLIVNIITVLLSHQWSKVCRQLPAGRNSILC